MNFSTIKDSMKEILGLLKSLQNCDGNPLFVDGSVQLWNDQVKRMKPPYEGLAFETPACFLEMSPFYNEIWLNGIAITDYNIRLHILYTQLDQGYGNFDSNFDVLDVRTRVRTALTNFTPCNMGSFMFQEEKQDFAHDALYHFVLTWKSRYIDQSGDPYVNGHYTKICRGKWTINVNDIIINPNSIGYCIIGDWWIS